MKETQDKKAKITLDDCLACVGCLTSAETILVEQQGTSSLLEQLRTESNRLIVVTLSPQSCASLAHQYRLSLLSATRKIASFFYSLGSNKIGIPIVDVILTIDVCDQEPNSYWMLPVGSIFPCSNASGSLCVATSRLRSQCPSSHPSVRAGSATLRRRSLIFFHTCHALRVLSKSSALSLR